MRFRTTLLVTALVCWAICALIGATAIWAAPFLTCDCTPAADTVTGFQLQDWGVSTWTNPLVGNKQLPTSPSSLKLGK